MDGVRNGNDEQTQGGHATDIHKQLLAILGSMSRYGKKRVSHQSRKQECTRPASSLNRHVEMSWCRDDRRNNLSFAMA